MSCQYGDSVRGQLRSQPSPRQQVARDLNLSERTLIRHEDGTTPLSHLHIVAYAAYYGVSPDSFYERSAA